MLDAFVDEGMVRVFQLMGEQRYRPQHMAHKWARKVPANVRVALEKLDERAVGRGPMAHQPAHNCHSCSAWRAITRR